MADWLYSHLPEVTASFLQRKRVKLKAKRQAGTATPNCATWATD